MPAVVTEFAGRSVAGPKTCRLRAGRQANPLLVDGMDRRHHDNPGFRDSARIARRQRGMSRSADSLVGSGCVQRAGSRLGPTGKVGDLVDMPRSYHLPPAALPPKLTVPVQIEGVSEVFMTVSRRFQTKDSLSGIGLGVWTTEYSLSALPPSRARKLVGTRIVSARPPPFDKPRIAPRLSRALEAIARSH